MTYSLYQVYSQKNNQLFKTLREAAQFARSHSKINPGLLVLLSTHYRRYNEQTV